MVKKRRESNFLKILKKLKKLRKMEKYWTNVCNRNFDNTRKKFLSYLWGISERGRRNFEDILKKKKIKTIKNILKNFRKISKKDLAKYWEFLK